MEEFLQKSSLQNHNTCIFRLEIFKSHLRKFDLYFLRFTQEINTRGSGKHPVSGFTSHTHMNMHIMSFYFHEYFPLTSIPFSFFSKA